MTGPGTSPDGAGDALRAGILVVLVVAPLAFGSVHKPAYIPLLVAVFVLGTASWARGRWRRVHGEAAPEVPAGRLLLGLHALVGVQLLPLPPSLLSRVSPGSFSFYNDPLLLPLREWRPVTVSPADTARGLIFLAAMCLLYATVFREFGEERWRRRLATAVAGTGFLMTLTGLVQAASGTTKIYGVWQPTWDWAVFGPYVNRNHFAGYLVMAIPLTIAFAAEALFDLRRAWGRRRWLALGDAEGNATLRRSAAAVVLIVGLLASQSRGGFVAAVLSAALLTLVLRHRLQATALIALVAAVAVGFVGLGGIARGFESRGIRTSRVELWFDAARMVPRFPLLGVGLNAFGTAYPQYQTIWKGVWFGEAHNEYLQALVDTGVAGGAIVLGLLARLLRAAARGALRSVLDAGVLGGILAACVHNLVDFNWQIPANAATFAALAGMALRRSEVLGGGPSGLQGGAAAVDRARGRPLE